MQISDFGENLGLWRKFRILAKILDFNENLGFHGNFDVYLDVYFGSVSSGTEHRCQSH